MDGHNSGMERYGPETYGERGAGLYEREAERVEAATPGPGARGGDQGAQLMEYGKVGTRFMRTPTGRQIQRSLFGVPRRR